MATTAVPEWPEMKVKFCHPLGNNREICSPVPVKLQTAPANWARSRRALGEGSHLRHTARSESPYNAYKGNAVHISIFGTPQCATNRRTAIRGFPKHLLF
jgi:hypothetical protein